MVSHQLLNTQSLSPLSAKSTSEVDDRHFVMAKWGSYWNFVMACSMAIYTATYLQVIDAHTNIIIATYLILMDL